ASKIINVKQEGTFYFNGRLYKLEREATSNSEIINFYLDDDTLYSSVFTKLLSKAKGVTEGGDFVREIYEDFSIIAEFNRILKDNRNKRDKNIIADRKLLLDEEGDGMIDVYERKKDQWFHKQV